MCCEALWQNHATQANKTPVMTPITPSNRSIFAWLPKNWAVILPNAKVAKIDAIIEIHITLILFLSVVEDTANRAINQASSPSRATTNVEANSVSKFLNYLFSCK